ncbi:type II toxin-antitoxin system death-on-curing family toxin [Arthrobacter sp. TMN-50]
MRRHARLRPWSFLAGAALCSFSLIVDLVFDCGWRVVAIHNDWSPAPLDNPHLLASAVEQLQATYMGVDLYETPPVKAAVLLRGIAYNHAFRDGNKRTGWNCAQVFLASNQSSLYQVDDEQAATFVEQAVAESWHVNQIAEWLIYRIAV